MEQHLLHFDLKELVFAYIRNIESLLSKQIIPDDIKLLCFMYYKLRERFVSHGRKLSLANDHVMIKFLDNSSWARPVSTAYGEIVIDGTANRNAVYTWLFELLQLTGDCLIGICSTSDHPNSNAFQRRSSSYKFYALNLKDESLWSHRYLPQTENENVPKSSTDNNRIVMTMNTCNRVLSWNQENRQMGTLGSIDNIDVSMTYQMAVSLSRKNDCVSIRSIASSHARQPERSKKPKMGWFDF